MKIRTQIQLEPDEYSALKDWAVRHGVSLSAAVRRLVRESFFVEKKRRREDVRSFLSVAGAIREKAGARNVSEEHDRYLYGSPSK